MDRNIITETDVKREQARRHDDEVKGPETKREEPIDTADAWIDRLTKYFPGEALALYLTLDGLIRSQALADTELQTWLGLALAVALIFCWLFLGRIWKVVRISQKAVSVGALVLYVFAIGGVFATFQWYAPWYGTISVVVGTAFLALLVPPPLPASPSPGSG